MQVPSLWDNTSQHCSAYVHKKLEGGLRADPMLDRCGLASFYPLRGLVSKLDWELAEKGLGRNTESEMEMREK